MKFNMSSICYEINDDAASAIADAFSQGTQLKELNLCNNNLHSETISIVLNKLNSLTLIKLNISHNHITDTVADDIKFFLSNCTKLAVFDISNNGLQSTGIAKLFKVKVSSLVSFNVSRNNINYDDMTKFLSQNVLLDMFDFSCNKGLLGIKNCFNKIPNKLNLYVLDLSNSNLNDELVDELTTVLVNTTLLKEFNVSRNSLSTSNAIKIFKGMENVSNLETINISHNRITHEAADDIATVLSHNSNLETLDLSHNLFGSKGCNKIFERLSNVVLLKRFNINNMEITDEATEIMGTFLSQNTMLEKLDISCNDLHAAGAIKIFSKMRTVSNLKELNISSNAITDAAAANIGVFLSQNNKLEKLDISSNNLQATGISKIFIRMKNILGLTELNICGNWITEKEADDITSFLSLND